MKKIVKVIIIILFLSSFIYWLIDKEDSNKSYEVKAIFISYIDYSSKLKGKTKEEQQEVIKEMITNIKNSNLNTIILQVRPFCDAIYHSNIFSSSKTVVEKEGDFLVLDILDYFVTLAHQNNLKLHAWINPYRIRSDTSTNTISKDNIIYSWLNTSYIEIKNGIYLNPSKKEVLNLILNGIKEIIENYEVDGILYDDYFYPSDTIDNTDYQEYLKNNGTLTLEEYRINNINNLIKESYNMVKSINKEVLFGISPSGNISNNLNNEYLDISFILKNNNYLDYVMPQLYYGFTNEVLPYIEILQTWNDLILNNDTKLYVALSLYKSGQIDKYAKKGKEEWLLNDDIIKRQIIVSREVSAYQGFAIFRYDFMYNYSKTNNNLINEVLNIINLLEENY